MRLIAVTAAAALAGALSASASRPPERRGGNDPVVQTEAAAGRGSQAARQPKQYTIEQFLNTTSITGASFSADESRILFSSNKTGIWNAYTVPTAGGPWTQVTASTTDSTLAVSFFPKDD